MDYITDNGNYIELKKTYASKERGAKIAYYRKLLKLTQEELGKKVGLSAKAISAWETGRNEPNMGQAYDLANIFDIDITDLMSKPSRINKNKEDLVEVIKAYEQADDLTKQMVRRILKIKEKEVIP
jgi:transcriptional regulator with XRE-family HTH domain